MRTPSRIALMLVVTFAAGAAFAQDAPPAEPKLTYDDHIKTIFRAKCANCHNTDKKTAGLDLTNYTSMMQGGASGAAIEAGKTACLLEALWGVPTTHVQPRGAPSSRTKEDTDE